MERPDQSSHVPQQKREGEDEVIEIMDPNHGPVPTIRLKPKHFDYSIGLVATSEAIVRLLIPVCVFALLAFVVGWSAWMLTCDAQSKFPVANWLKYTLAGDVIFAVVGMSWSLVRYRTWRPPSS